MREIKFRGWFKLTKKMYYPAWDCRDAVEFGEHGMDAGKENWILMQFTGLKDKNGKEIYEGDILQGSDTSPKYKVEMNSGAWSASYYFQGNSGSFTIYDKLNIFEVIGNIYENPELLAEEQK